MRVTLFVLLGGATLFAAAFDPLPPGGASAALNRQELISRSKGAPRAAAVFAGDTLLPSVGSGPSLRTELTFVNLSARQATFSLQFLKFDGTDLYLPVEGNGEVRGGRITVAANEIFVIRTEKTAALTEGWALIRTENLEDCIGSFSKMLLAVDGYADMRITIPTVDKYENKTVLAFDNVNGRTMATVVNGSVASSRITATVRSAAGEVMATEQLTIDQYKGAAGYLDVMYPVTAGRRGTLTIEASDFGAGVTGMQFTELSISAIPALSNPGW